MPTTTKAKKRLNITLTPELEFALKALSKRNKVPQATIAADLLKDAIEIMEDQVWAEIAEERKKKNKRYYSHEETWAHLK